MQACCLDRLAREGMACLLRSPSLCVWFHRLHALETAVTLLLWVVTASCLASPKVRYERTLKPRLHDEVAVFCCLSLARLLEACIRAACSEGLAARRPAAELPGPLVRCLARSLRWMLATSASSLLISLVVYALGAAAGVNCYEAGAGEVLVFTCHLRSAAYWSLTSGSSCVFLLSAVMLALEKRLQPKELETEKQGKELHAASLRRAGRSGGRSGAPLPGHCLICLEDFQRGERIRILPCGHRYHMQCVDVWLSHRFECPLRCHVDLEEAREDIESLDSSDDDEDGHDAHSPPAELHLDSTQPRVISKE
mmetsp:Transcript_39861/g.114845  ORF Transcript_39861/g.114845 Transcript_39861/m.114845 type:complete len:310 (-) Transcript_39861:414-1343(-)